MSLVIVGCVLAAVGAVAATGSMVARRHRGRRTDRVRRRRLSLRQKLTDAGFTDDEMRRYAIADEPARPRRAVVEADGVWSIEGSDFSTSDRMLAEQVAMELDRVDPLPAK